MKPKLSKYHEENMKGLEWDIEWATDWQRIREIYKKIEDLEELFGELDVSYLRDLTQKSLILNLKKYAWSLKGLIIEKYGDILPESEKFADF